MSGINALESLLGISGALIANITGIGGGVFFYPYLLNSYHEGDVAFINSVCIQIVGMGAGSLFWALKEKISYEFLKQLTGVVVTGYLGIIAGRMFLDLSQDSLMILFSLATIALSVVSLTQRKLQIHVSSQSRKGWILEKIFIFFSGAITSQISIGFGECVMLIRYLYTGNFRYAVRLAVTSSAVLLSIYALTSDLKPDTDIMFSTALGTIPGAFIGFYLTSIFKYHDKLKACVFSVLIGFGVIGLIGGVI